MNDLDIFFKPKSVAIIGASKKVGKIGNVIFSNFLESNFRGNVFPVNPSGGTIYGKKVFSNILDIPKQVDMVVLATKAQFVRQAMLDCAKKGVKGAIIISGGFAEIGKEGLARQEQILKVARQSGIRVIGPNCIGIYDTDSEIDTMFLPRYRMSRPRRGNIAFVSQSGAFGVAVLDWAASRGFGVSKFISLGNRIDIDELDCLEYLSQDDQSRVISLYLESTADGRRFIQIAKRIVKKKPLVVLKAGVTQRGMQATLSHTGSLAGMDTMYGAAFHQSGIIRANGPQDLFDVARALANQPLPKGDSVAIITNGGGFGVMATDAVAQLGLKMACFSDETQKYLKKNLPSIVSVNNPVDLVGDADAERYRLTIDALLEDSNVDQIIIIILFQAPSLQPDIVEVLAASNDRRKKPILVCTAGGDFADLHTKMIERAGLQVYPSPTSVVRSMATLLEYKKYKEKNF
jgi:acetyl coenzyme A synthetase (ADP forming)-like protein